MYKVLHLIWICHTVQADWAVGIIVTWEQCDFVG